MGLLSAVTVSSSSRLFLFYIFFPFSFSLFLPYFPLSYISSTPLMADTSDESDLTDLDDEDDLPLSQQKAGKLPKDFEIRGALAAPRTVTYTTQALYGPCFRRVTNTVIS